jgi:hypothetical protein
VLQESTSMVQDETDEEASTSASASGEKKAVPY